MIWFVLQLGFIALGAMMLCIFCDACTTHTYTNPATPGITRLQTNNSQEQKHTSNAQNDVQDAKDMVRRIEYKDAVLAQ